MADVTFLVKSSPEPSSHLSTLQLILQHNVAASNPQPGQSFPLFNWKLWVENALKAVHDSHFMPLLALVPVDGSTSSMGLRSVVTTATGSFGQSDAADLRGTLAISSPNICTSIVFIFSLALSSTSPVTWPRFNINAKFRTANLAPQHRGHCAQPNPRISSTLLPVLYSTALHSITLFGCFTLHRIRTPDTAQVTFRLQAADPVLYAKPPRHALSVAHPPLVSAETWVVRIPFTGRMYICPPPQVPLAIAGSVGAIGGVAGRAVDPPFSRSCDASQWGRLRSTSADCKEQSAKGVPGHNELWRGCCMHNVITALSRMRARGVEVTWALGQYHRGWLQFRQREVEAKTGRPSAPRDAEGALARSTLIMIRPQRTITMRTSRDIEADS
ncbi:hypothetical protein C8R45DRAFT_1108574 [Mycena sanguinolenta]|nr:hypothetical protein C8R45DRAFT_1108574 [Mycena sanguinolenta]